MKLSLVVPCYNEEGNIKTFYDYVKDKYKGVKNYELIFVNDGSKDSTFKELKEISSIDKKHIKVLSFSRNFGKEAAMLAGLKHSEGDYVAIIDADMQQDPLIVLEMLDILQNDDSYDIVAAFQEKRREGKLLSFLKNNFYSIINDISQVEFRQGASDFRLFRRSVVEAILSLEEKNRFSKGIFSFVGYNTYYLPYIPEERNAGVSSFSFSKLLNYAISGIVSFSTKPLRIPIYLGITFFIATFITLILFLFNMETVLGLAILILFISGLQFIVIGIMGEYISQMHIESKNRPVYIIKDKINIK